MWWIACVLIILFLLVFLVRYHLTIRSLTQQIGDKRRTGSQVRLTLRDQAPSLVALTDEVERLFQEMDNLGMVSRRLEALMEYRRLMEGAIRPSLQRVDLSQLVTQQLFAYYDAFQRAGIDLDVDLSENLLLETDSDIFDRIIQNMLSNVLKHGREVASISLKKKGQKVIFQVKNKVQKPILHLDKLTNRFYSENLSSSEESSGLGLYITQQLVEILGGDLTIQAEDDWFELIVAL